MLEFVIETIHCSIDGLNLHTFMELSLDVGNAAEVGGPEFDDTIEWRNVLLFFRPHGASSSFSIVSWSRAVASTNLVTFIVGLGLAHLLCFKNDEVVVSQEGKEESRGDKEGGLVV